MSDAILDRIPEIDPSHFSYGRSDSDDPSRIDVTTGKVITAPISASGLTYGENTQAPFTQLKQANPFKDFIIIPSKQSKRTHNPCESEPEVVENASEAVLSETDPGSARKSKRARVSTLKGAEREKETRDAQAKSAVTKKRKEQKQNDKERKQRDKADKAKAIVAGALSKVTASTSSPTDQGLIVRPAASGSSGPKLLTRAGLEDTSSHVLHAGENRNPSEMPVVDVISSDANSDIDNKAAQDAANVIARRKIKKSPEDLLGVFSSVIIAKHPSTKQAQNCRQCLVCT